MNSTDWWNHMGERESGGIPVAQEHEEPSVFRTEDTPSHRRHDGTPFADLSVVSLGIITGVSVFVATLCVILFVPKLYFYIQRKAQDPEKLRKKRLLAIDEWLITKTVVSPSNRSQKVSDKVIDDHGEGGNEEEEDGEDSGEVECTICMEAFAAGDKVSWSPSTICNHVFHYKCISEWLKSHKECPYCRQVYLPGVEESMSRRKLKALVAERREKSSTTYYFLEAGLVVEDKYSDALVVEVEVCEPVETQVPWRDSQS